MARSTMLIAVLLVAAAAPPGFATLVAGLDLAQLVERADRVVHGRIVRVSAVRAEGRFTDSIVTMVPQAVLKGAVDREIAFRVPGGEAGRFRTIVVGAPTLRVDDEVVVFLAGSPPLMPHLVGFSQGVLPVVRDDTGRAILVVPPPSPANGAARVMTLSAFADDVRALVEAKRGSRRSPGLPSRRTGAGPSFP